MSFVQPQPPPTKGDSPAVWPMVIADLEGAFCRTKTHDAIRELVREDMTARDALGRERYGTPLQVDNGRDPIVDAYQEALDLAVYLRQEMERDTPGYPQREYHLALELVLLLRERLYLR